jgi:GNAT superfamily N-acetyltransferase
MYPLSLLSPPAPFATASELEETLTGDTIIREAAFCAMSAEEVVSAAIPVSREEEAGWWRVATRADRRREGLASECVRMGERALRDAGVERLTTETIVDTRWPGADALFDSLDYALVDPQERNITMVADEWEPRAPAVAAGYSIATLADASIDEWMTVRNAIFGGSSGPEWFHERFSRRPDYDPHGWHIVRHEGRIVGMAGALAVKDDWNGRRVRGGQIEYVGVLEEHRGLGLGEALMVACLNYLAEREHLPALLLTQPFRVPAVRLYEKLGFHITGAWHRWRKSLI